MNTNEQTQQICEPYIALLHSAMNNVRVAVPGIVTDYNKEYQTVSVQPTVMETIHGEKIRLPILTDVPVFFPGGSDISVIHAVNIGDECLVIFADTAIDAWWQSGGIQTQASVRRHSLSDGFALVGFRSRPNAAPTMDSKYAVRVKTDSGWVDALTVDNTGTVGLNMKTAKVSYDDDGNIAIEY